MMDRTRSDSGMGSADFSIQNGMTPVPLYELI